MLKARKKSIYLVIYLYLDIDAYILFVYKFCENKVILKSGVICTYFRLNVMSKCWLIFSNLFISISHHWILERWA